MKWLYNIGIRSYKLGVLTAGLLGSNKAIKWVEGRKNWLEKLQKSECEHPIWIHASSLGEFEMAKPLIEKIKADPKLQKTKILVTFFSPSGYEISLNYPLADGIHYIPLDTRANAKLFLDLVQPQIAIFVKYDFWFNFLSELQARKIPTLYFSSNFRQGQFYFKKGVEWQKKIMQKIDSILCLNDESNQVLKKHGFSNTGICGDTRFDKVIQNAQRIVPVPLMNEFKKDNKLLIMGSSWPIEEKIVADFLAENALDDLKVIIAPHDISEDHLKEIEALFDRGLVRFSKINKSNALTSKILLIDNIGMLSNLYQYGDIAFIGGGFTNSLHNVLEAAAMGNALIYGGNIKKYPEGIELAKEGGSFSINESGFEKALKDLIENPALLQQCQQKSKEFVYKHQGATDIVYNEVLNLL